MARMSRWNGFVGASVRDSARMTGNSGTYRRLHPNFQIADDPLGTVIWVVAQGQVSFPAPSVGRVNDVIRRVSDAFDVPVAPAFTTRVLHPGRFS
jgi:hypothetical protein